MNEELVNVLRLSVSQNQHEFGPATDQLRQLSAEAGFYHNLLQISLQFDTIEPDVRLAALLQLKCGVERNWRSYCTNAISENEKDAIKNQILQCLQEKVPRVARQFSYIISKMARSDVPQLWPGLVPDLLTRISAFQTCSANPQYDHFLTFYTFRMVLTEMASRQLMAQRSKLQELCGTCLPVLLGVWDTCHNHVVQMLSTDQGDPRTMLLMLDIDLNIEKSLKRIAKRVGGEHLTQLVRAVILAQTGLCELAHGVKRVHSDEVREKFDKILVTLSKITVEVLDHQVALPPEVQAEIVDFNRKCVTAYADNRDALPVRFVVNCMNQMKMIAQNLDENNNHKILNGDQLIEFVKCLIFKYFPLSNEDMELWNDDIVEFCTEEIGETWRFNLRPSAEVLFMTLLRAKSSQICPMIFETIEYLKQNQDNGMEMLIMESAIYTSLSLAASQLFDCFDFEDYFKQTLIPRSQQIQNQTGGKIIHRAILKLLTAWLDVKPFTVVIKDTWNFILSSLHPQLDFAVRFEAAMALKQFLYDFENDISYFTPHQESCVQSLKQLLDESSDDLKMQILDVFNRIIERIDQNAIVFIEQLTLVLQSIWMKSERHEMLRCSVLVTMINIIEVTRDLSYHLHPIVLPMISTSCNINQQEHVYLMLDGLELWTSVMHHANEVTQDLMQLFPLVYATLELGIEEARLGYHIVECYLLIGGIEFTEHHYFTSLANTLNCLCHDMSDDMLGFATDVLDHAIQMSPRQTAIKFGKCIIKIFQMALNGEIYGSKKTNILSLGIWLNILCKDDGPDFLRQLFIEENYGVAAYRMVQLVSSHIDSFVESEQKKAASISIILTADRLLLNNDVVSFKQCLPDVICTCLQTLHDVCDDKCTDEVVIADGEVFCGNPDISDDNSHQKRCRKLLRNRITFQVSLPQIVAEHLQKWKNSFDNHHQQDLQGFLNQNVDSLILAELHNYLNV